MQGARAAQRGEPRQPSQEWFRRPVLSSALRALIVLGPIAASWGVAIIVSRALPSANSVSTAALWIIFITAASLLTLVLFERAVRRLLPLAALLDVSLLFPDRAPERFAIARRSGDPKDLRRRLQRALDEGHQDDARSMQVVIELCLALSVHDRATRGHSERVRVFTDLIADEMKVPERDRALLRWAAILHDIGKLDVSASILNKKGKPSGPEWESIHRHPVEGARLVAPLLPWLGEWGTAVVQHHERVDGTGYPNRLEGDQISLAARIVSVADCYEVMTAPRSYKRPMTVSAARQELVAAAGSQLDPEVVRAFLNVAVGRLWRIIGIGAWMAQIPSLGRFASSMGSWAAPGVATATTAGVIAFGGVARVSPPVHLLAVPPPLARPCATVRPVSSASSTPTATATPTPSPSPSASPSSGARSPVPSGTTPSPRPASATTTPTPTAAPSRATTPRAAPTPSPPPTPSMSSSPSPTPSTTPASASTPTATASPSGCR
ncbi:MAG: HD-GYP domain-containing protein [Candidatus Dormibacteraeota bacterium]|uniref:HD-GYP domain-containing protein n=1 Tax=Candidatus Amunia macphersoniae TaxID=3127014 RepID=A0A934KMK3_9BACT|nr:HD-GYP domain-containing protein [Candidatus Dormibacteraeota bacterium]